METPFLWIVVGPTASGKSECAMCLAEHLSAEIISADSQQVYRGMDIGTGKLKLDERRGIPHHMLDVIEPDQEMTTADFKTSADLMIQNNSDNKKHWVIAGGTMLYIRSLLLGLSEAPGADAAIRQRWEDFALEHGVEAIRGELQNIDPILATRIERNDKKRLIRAMEVFELTGKPLSEYQRAHDFNTVKARYNHKWIGLRPPMDTLDQRINQRVQNMIDAGFVEEVRTLRKKGYDSSLRSQMAIGYGELHSYIEGDMSLDEAVTKTQQRSRKYARRQLSWYRDQNNINWLEDLSKLDLSAIGRY